MNLGQLKKKVAKEFSKSPAKTIVLIALCPVALYFVVPLFLPNKSNVDPSLRAQVIDANVQSKHPQSTTTTTSTSNQTEADAAGSGATWRQLNALIEADWRRTSGKLTQAERNPFGDLVEETPEKPVELKQPEAPVVSQEAFNSLQLRLTGTVVGGKSRWATVNGVRFQEGQEMAASLGLNEGRNPRDTTSQRVRLVLLLVAPDHAMVEFQGRYFRLDSARARTPGSSLSVERSRD